MTKNKVNISVLKSTLRPVAKDKRDSLNLKEIREKSEEIREKLCNLNIYRKSKVISTYVSKESEVRTIGLIKTIIKSKDKKVIVPFLENNLLKMGRINSLSEMQLGLFNILEPRFKKIYSGMVDLIIVPGLAFDEQGNRLGYGKGYYDQYLINFINKPTIKIGLAFELQIVPNVPAEEQDVKMDYIVTEKRVIDCNKRKRTKRMPMNTLSREN